VQAAPGPILLIPLLVSAAARVCGPMLLVPGMSRYCCNDAAMVVIKYRALRAVKCSQLLLSSRRYRQWQSVAAVIYGSQSTHHTRKACTSVHQLTAMQFTECVGTARRHRQLYKNCY